MRCHRDGPTGIYIPVCWGGVIYGKHRCTCYTKTYPDLEATLLQARARIMELEHKVDILQEELREADDD